LDLNDYYLGDSESLSRLNYLLNDLKLDDNKIKKLAGNLYSRLVKHRQR
jgi:hypothetical protein